MFIDLFFIINEKRQIITTFRNVVPSVSTIKPINMNQHHNWLVARDLNSSIKCVCVTKKKNPQKPTDYGLNYGRQCTYRKTNQCKTGNRCKQWDMCRGSFNVQWLMGTVVWRLIGANLTQVNLILFLFYLGEHGVVLHKCNMMLINQSHNQSNKLMDLKELNFLVYYNWQVDK